MHLIENSIPITKENIDKVLEFMPYFENKDNIFFTVVDCWVEDSAEVINFLHTLYKENFTTSYVGRKGERRDGNHISLLLNRAIPLSEANILDIRALFKKILAGDRLTMGGGFIAASIENGLVLDILKRLKEIRDEMD
ncbi:MAG TPA: DUF6508 domain-containing protein [Methanofastidiosum sp.]|nr:DUF6508 domain-containing protein [Methanofastidiosum sp.]